MIVVRVLLALSILASLSSAGAQSPQPTPAAPKAPFSISISTPNATVKAGSDVIVNIVLTNTSDRDINYSIAKTNESAEVDFGVDVRDANGYSAQHTKWGHQLKGEETIIAEPMQMGSLEIKLKPGESTRPRIIINRLFEVNHPGKYKIRVARFDPDSGASAFSNTVTVTIVP